jgi:hypothetical protein
VASHGLVDRDADCLRATTAWSWPGRGVGPVELGAGVDVQLGEDIAHVYFTVRTLMNNRLPISAFDRPSRAAAR